MIKPKELALGNVVLYKGRIREVVTINYNWLISMVPYLLALNIVREFQLLMACLEKLALRKSLKVNFTRL